MSRIYFHTKTKTAEVRGNERALMGNFCSKIFIDAVNIDAEKLKTILPKDCYLHEFDKYKFPEAFKTWASVGMEKIKIKGKQTDIFSLQLNTAIRLGNDVVKLMARLHGSCEIHAWVKAKNKKWLADIIKKGRKIGILRADMGWEDVIKLLNEKTDEDVVTSYSVCESFPNRSIAGWEDDNDGEDFYELSGDKQWELSFKGLLAEPSLEMQPDNWETFYFNEGYDAFTINKAVS